MLSTETAAFTNSAFLRISQTRYSSHKERRFFRVSCCDTSGPSTPSTAAKQPPASQNDVELSAVAAAAATLVLHRAVEKPPFQRPRPGIVINALLQLEREQKRNKARTDISQLCGKWALVANGNKQKKSPLNWPRYFPFRTQLEFHPGDDGPETGAIKNSLFVAGSLLRFTGVYRWVAKSNRVEFTFSKMAVKIGPFKTFEFDGIDKEGSELGSRTAKTLPFFTFFHARNGIACARGRTGGLAIFKRVKDS